MRAWWLLTVSLVLTGCPKDDAPAPLDERLDPGQVRAGKIERRQEAVGGPTADVRIGGFKLYNSRIAVVVDTGLQGFHSAGATIVAADVIRPEGEPARSTFGEIVPGFDLSVQRPVSISVVSDGTDGTAIVRVEGTSQDFPLLSALLGSLLDGIDALEWTTEYELKPDASFVTITHRLKNTRDTAIEVGLPLLAFFFGTGARPYVEAAGFSASNSGVNTPYYAAVADDVSYLYARTDEQISIVFGESGIVLASAGRDFSIGARDTLVIEERLFVGDGDIDKTIQAWRTAGGGTSEQIAGRVVNASGVAVEGAHVHVTKPSDPEGRDYETRATSGSDGRFVAHVRETGAYTLRASTSERMVTEAIMVTTTNETELRLGATGTLTIEVKEGEAPVPAKVSVEQIDRPVPPIPRYFGERAHGRGLYRTEFVTTEPRALVLPVGSYNVHVSRGNEYEVVTERVEISADTPVVLVASMTRSVSSAGWVTADTHVHAERSPDSPDSYAFKVRAMAAQNIEVAVSTDHEAVGDFQPAIEEQGLSPFIRGIAGTEISTTRYGHFNAFPLVPDRNLPGFGRMTAWYSEPPAVTFAQAKLRGEPFVQVNHPRMTGIGYFSVLEFDRDTFTSPRNNLSLDFDGLEVLNGCPTDARNDSSVRDWFAFLDRGMRRTAVASPDDHEAGEGLLGYPLSYVALDESPAAITPVAVRDAFLGGHVAVSCGPFVTLQIGDAKVGDIVTATSGRLDVTVRVEAPGWMDVDAVDIIVNGKIASTLPMVSSQPGLRLMQTVTATLTPGTDGYVLAWARGDEPHGIWAQSKSSFAFTNPIFVDGDGDGRWGP